MEIFGLSITRAKKELAPVSTSRGWFPIIRESFTGAWQRNIHISADTVATHHADFACKTLIASDIAKLRVKLVMKDSDGIWSEVTNPAYSPVLRKPNNYQNRLQFFESWVLSKLQSGNTYVLKQRDLRGVVVKLYVLDPGRCRPLVSEDGSVYYELMTDTLSEVPQDRLVVPAREIIHDRFNCFYHPLVGLSPIFANGLAAMQGLAIQNNSTLLFQNGARPSGILTAPGDISKQTADELKAYWETNFSGTNAAKVAVLGDGLEYKAMTMNAVDSEVIAQLKWTAEVICSTYHVPPYKIGIGQQPTYNNVQALNTEYYSQCLQIHLEQMEACLDEGLGMDGVTIGTEFDVENLLRMDAATQMDVLEKSKGKLTVNEQRAKLDKKPVKGGDTVYLQEQDHSLEWLSKRDAMPIEAPAPPPAPANDDDAEAEREAAKMLLAVAKGLA